MSFLLLPSVRLPSLSFSRLIHLLFIASSAPRLRHSTLSNRPFSSLALAMMSSAAHFSHVVAAVDVEGASDIDRRIREHQAAAARLSPLEEVRTIVDNSIRGILSTNSLEHVGYPLGSTIDFACDQDGTLVLAVNSIAIHLKNLLANPKCSLLVAKDFEGQTDLAITLFGDAILISEDDREALKSVYLRKHPNASWVDSGEFLLIQIHPKFVHYVSGDTSLLGCGEFNAEDFRTAKVDPISQFSIPISSHMNKDHAEDTKAIVQYSTSIKVEFAYMLDVDSLGFNAKAGYHGSTYKLRVPFPRRALDRKDVKTLIIEMLHAARGSV